MAIGSHNGAMKGEAGDSDLSFPFSSVTQGVSLHLMSFQGLGVRVSSACESEGRKVMRTGKRNG